MTTTPLELAVDLGIVGAIALLVLWAFAALVMEGPGWVHLFLTLGVFLLIYRIVVLGTPGEPKDKVSVQPKGKKR